jgi:hypothetical protein
MSSAGVRIGCVEGLISFCLHYQKVFFTASVTVKQQETYFMRGQLHYILKCLELVLNFVTELVCSLTCQIEDVLD